MGTAIAFPTCTFGIEVLRKRWATEKNAGFCFGPYYDEIFFYTVNRADFFLSHALSAKCVTVWCFRTTYDVRKMSSCLIHKEAWHDTKHHVTT